MIAANMLESRESWCMELTNSAIETFATVPVISWIVTITHLSLTESVLNSGNVNGGVHE